MKRTTKAQQQQPTREQATEGIMRTVKRLQVQYGADPQEPLLKPGNIKLQKAIFKGWVVAFPYEKAQYIACIHYPDTVFRLTPAGNILFCHDDVIKKTSKHIRELIKERSRETH